MVLEQIELVNLLRFRGLDLAFHLGDEHLEWLADRARPEHRLDEVDGSGPGRGRFYGQAPEIDSICYIEKCSAKPGEFISVKVVGTRDYDLVVRPIL